MPLFILLPDKSGRGTTGPLGRYSGIRKEHKRWLTAGLILLVAVVLLFALRWRKEEFDWSLFGSTLLKLRWSWLAFAALLGVSTYYARALRWAVMLRHLKDRPNVWGLFSATAIGFTAIVLLGRAGELVRPYLISVKEKVPFSSQLAAWLIERIFDTLAAMLIFGFALTQTAKVSLPPDSLLAWILRTGGYLAGLASAVSLGVFVAFQQSSETLSKRLGDALGFLPGHLHARVSKLLESFVLGVRCVRDRSSVFALSAFTLAEWILIVASFAACFRAFPALDPLGLGPILVTVGFVAVGSLIQIPGIGGGSQLMIIVVVTEIYNLPLEIAGGLAMIVYFITFIVILPFGLVLLVAEGLSLRRLRELQAQELA